MSKLIKTHVLNGMRARSFDVPENTTHRPAEDRGEEQNENDGHFHCVTA